MTDNIDLALDQDGVTTLIKEKKRKAGAPKGNKFALGNNGGRPRTVSPDPDKCHELGKEMIEWVKANQPTHLSEWFSIEKMIPWKTWNTMVMTEEFLPYYEKALSMVASNARNGKLHPSIAQRFLSLYHRDLKAEEVEKAKFEHSLKTEEVQSYSQELKKDMDAFMNQIKSSQKTE